MLKRCDQVNNVLQVHQQRTRLVYQKDTIFAPVTSGNQARYAPAATAVHPNGAPVLPSMFLTGKNLPYAIENPPVAMGRPAPFTGTVPLEQKEGPYCRPYVPPPGSVPISLDPARQGARVFHSHLRPQVRPRFQALFTRLPLTGSSKVKQTPQSQLWPRVLYSRDNPRCFRPVSTVDLTLTSKIRS